MQIISSTQTVPSTSSVPQHVAIIMDGNGRWATQRHLPRTAGHIKGIATVRKVVRYCVQKGIRYLTLFSFSSENWRRPKEEVDLLMRLFTRALKREIARLHQNNIRLRVVGDVSAFDPTIQALITQAESLTVNNTGLTLSIAANYGGRWDILQAIAKYQQSEKGQAHKVPTEADFSHYLSMAWAPEPDLFIRTGGEQRISNFLIWQLAYTELYFTPVYWPEFSTQHLDQAIVWYAGRERRFGRTGIQLQES